ncbi:hypothetical protein ABRZ00_12840 [Castellaniella ginsengisoli]|uniref:Uncharacterized protein n=1 Tax=Castellaniella ginsengisoli TaxID=546114 RepID=A0AB39DN88_9BURK
MPDPENIVYQDSQITQILEFHKGAAAPVLFERYRMAGANQEAFVAALIGRLCVLEGRQTLDAGRRPNG